MASTSSLKQRVFLARNDKIDSALAATALADAMSAGSGFEYIASLEIRPDDWDVAHAVGVARTTIAKAGKLNSSKFRRGDQDERIDTEGAMGEWLTAGLLHRAGADAAALVAFKAPKGEVDLILEGKRVDVKTMGQTSGRQCNINREQHFTKTPDGYLVVHIVRADVADLYLVRAKEVEESWQLRSGWSPYYNRYLAKQLADLPEPEEVAA